MTMTNKINIEIGNILNSENYWLFSGSPEELSGKKDGPEGGEYILEEMPGFVFYDGTVNETIVLLNSEIASQADAVKRICKSGLNLVVVAEEEVELARKTFPEAALASYAENEKAEDIVIKSEHLPPNGDEKRIFDKLVAYVAKEERPSS
jgi:hypothetical protein